MSSVGITSDRPAEFLDSGGVRSRPNRLRATWREKGPIPTMAALKSAVVAGTALAALSLIYGCGGSSGGVAPPTNRGVARDNVVLLPSDSSVVFSKVTDSGLTVSGTSAA